LCLFYNQMNAASIRYGQGVTEEVGMVRFVFNNNSFNIEYNVVNWIYCGILLAVFVGIFDYLV